jgi:hypothetical protein
MNELQLQIEALKEKIAPEYSKSIDVDEGWYQLVIDCDKELTAIDPHYRVFQIKEKFGGLRYYFHPSQSDTSKAMNEVVSKYEAIAARTCEATGGPGVLMKSIGGWRKTLNPEYAAKSRPYGKYTYEGTQ